jgi:hypothetical protein
MLVDEPCRKGTAAWAFTLDLNNKNKCSEYKRAEAKYEIKMGLTMTHYP